MRRSCWNTCFFPFFSFRQSCTLKAVSKYRKNGEICKKIPYLPLVCFIARCQCNQFQDFLQILNKPHGHYHHGKSCFCSFRFKAKNLNFIKFWKGGGWKKNFFKPLFGVLAKIDVLSILSFPIELYPQGNGHISQKFSDLNIFPIFVLFAS